VIMRWEKADEISKRVEKIVVGLEWEHVDISRIVCMRSFGSSARARARIWGLPRVWQQSLAVEAHYIIEVISEKFDHLSQEEQEKILIHELLHIPKSFSGALVPHRGRGRKQHLSWRKIEQLFSQLNRA